MAWTMPKTWTVDELLSAGDLNVHLRDNLVYLKTERDTLRSEVDVLKTGSGLALAKTQEASTTSSTFVAVTGLSGTLTIAHGGRALVILSGDFTKNTAGTGDVRIVVGASNYNVTRITYGQASSNTYTIRSYAILTDNLASGDYTVEVRYLTSDANVIVCRASAQYPVRLTAVEV